ncbi:MAG: trimeric intracellular cation channel family protein [Clostridia bacterium]|nr:trimeric intracellular cation channel family protein [Clostridia bacterium]
MQYIEIFELIGVVAFAMAGVLVGIEYGFDLFGIFVLAFLTALGGGLFRDIMLGNHPPVCFTHFSYIICVAITVVVSLIFLKVFDTHLGTRDIHKIKALITFFDAVGLGIFCVTGTIFAMEMGFADNMLLCVASGLVTSIVGGMCRDVLATRKPVVLRKEIYAVAAIVGSVLYYLTYDIIGNVVAIYLCAIIVTVIRLVSVRKRVNMLFRVKNKKLMDKDDEEERYEYYGFETDHDGHSDK